MQAGMSASFEERFQDRSVGCHSERPIFSRLKVTDKQSHGVNASFADENVASGLGPPEMT